MSLYQVCVALCKKDQRSTTWVWVKIKPPGDRRLLSLFPFTRVPVGVPIFVPQPRVPDTSLILGFRHAVDTRSLAGSH